VNEGNMTNELASKEPSADLWTELDRAFQEMGARLFDPLGLSPLATAVRSDGALFRPARTDVTDTGASYRVVAEVPGIPKEKLDIRVRGSVVEIRAENESETEEKEERYLRRERTYAGYYRALELPEPVVASDAKAQVVNGLLELELPKQHPTASEEEVRVSVK